MREVRLFGQAAAREQINRPIDFAAWRPEAAFGHAAVPEVPALRDRGGAADPGSGAERGRGFAEISAAFEPLGVKSEGQREADSPEPDGHEQRGRFDDLVLCVDKRLFDSVHADSAEQPGQDRCRQERSDRAGSRGLQEVHRRPAERGYC